MKNPISQILTFLGMLWVCVGIVGVVTGPGFGVTILIPLGIILGPYMGLVFPFSVAFKVFYALSLLVSLTITVVGWRTRAKYWGRVLCIMGVIGWTCAGMIGLGTAT